MDDFAQIMEARVPRMVSPRSQSQVGWLGHSGRFWPITSTTDEVHAVEKGGYLPLYMDEEP